MAFSVFAPRPTSGDPPRVPANTRTPSVLGRGAAAYGRKHEVAALLLWTLALFLILALATYRGDPSGTTPVPPTPPGADVVGPVGDAVARALVSLLGVIGWTLPLELCLLGIPLVRGRPSPLTPGRVAGDLLLVVVAAALVQVGGSGRVAFGTHPAGGLVGELFGEARAIPFSRRRGRSWSGSRVLGLILIGRAAFFVHRARATDGPGGGADRGLGGRSRAGGRAGVGRGAGASRSSARRWRARRTSPASTCRRRTRRSWPALPFEEDDGVASALVDDLPPPPVRRSRRPKAESGAVRKAAPAALCGGHGG